MRSIRWPTRLAETAHHGLALADSACDGGGAVSPSPISAIRALVSLGAESVRFYRSVGVCLAGLGELAARLVIPGSAAARRHACIRSSRFRY
jgi:hypothetical protein